MRMKQVATRQYFYVSPLLPSYRFGSKIDKRKIFSPWKSKNNASGCSDKVVKEIVKSNIRDVCSIKPLHYTPDKSNKSGHLDTKRFRPQEVRALYYLEQETILFLNLLYDFQRN